MSSVINKSSAVDGNWASSQASSKDKQILGKDDFLKLLVTQLRNQDPLKSEDNKAFIAEMAQFSSLELMQNLTQSIDNLRNEIINSSQQSLLVQGTALIGKQVTGFGKDGQMVEGVVDSIKWINDSVEVQIGQENMYLQDIITVTP